MENTKKSSKKPLVVVAVIAGAAATLGIVGTIIGKAKKSKRG